jgi:UDP-glucuronate 4-epimerase
MKSKKKILVTGACGFIGFHISSALKNRGDEVIGIDNFNPYYSPQLKRDRQKILEEASIPIIDDDIVKEGLFKSLFEKEQFTHVIHLAAQAGVRYSKENPYAYLKSNIEGFLKLIEQLRLFPQIKLVYASSSSVYGCNKKTPFSPNDQTDQPANFYAATKKMNELMAYSYGYLYDLKAIGLRYFTVYGPWGRPDMAYFSFAQSILEGKPIHLFNEGKMFRDFTYIDDVVDATLAALELEKEGKPIYNIGNHHPEQVLTLIALLEKNLKRKANIVLEKGSLGEVENTFADIEDARRDLQFAPKTSLEDGIFHFLNWFKEYYSI